ncbi:SRPBCC family protein [Mycolicibacterium sp. GCM10028919]|uniref:SRPBCC family protein n=1 Tax=Mycolicibacterium sp. GCM10028919 TaxID=3273401 RepID=UPI003610C26A
MTILEFSDSVLIERTPGEVYAMVSDVTRMGEWSPICKACWWDDPAAGATAGAWFTGRNETPEGRNGATGEVVPARTWETRSQVVVAEPDREFAWQVNDGWVRWGFRLEPAGENGTRLTQHWRFLPKGIAGFGERFGEHAQDQIALRSDHATSGIPVTLAAIKASAEGN